MIEAELTRCVASWCPGATGVTRGCETLRRRQPGNLELSISFRPDGNIGAILRRAPKGYGAAPSRAAGLENEAILMRLAFEAGVPSPRVLHVLRPEDDLGTGFIMARVEGETIARKILRDEQFATGAAAAGASARDNRGRHSRPAARQIAGPARDEFDQGNRRARSRVQELQLAAAGVRTGAALAEATTIPVRRTR